MAFDIFMQDEEPTEDDGMGMPVEPPMESGDDDTGMDAPVA